MKKRKDIILLYAFSFSKNLLFFGAVAVPFYLHRIGLNYTEMFLLETVFGVSMILFEIPTGVVADKFGRKISLFWGAVFFGGAFFFFGIFTSYYSLVILEIICAFGMTMLSGADRALLYETLKSSGEEQHAAKTMARYDAFSTAGMLFSFPAGSLIAGSGIMKYETALGFVFIISGIAIILSGLIVIFVKENFCETSNESFVRKGGQGFLFIFKHSRLRLFSFNYALISSLTFFMFWFYQTLLIENKFPVSGMGFIAAAFNGSAMILLLMTPLAQKYIGTHKTLFFSSIIPGFMYVMVAFIPGLVPALIAIFTVTGLKLFRAPMLSALMNEHIENSNRATVLSGVSMIERIMTSILYPVVGILMDVSMKLVFASIGVITIILAIALRGEEVKE